MFRNIPDRWRATRKAFRARVVPNTLSATLAYGASLLLRRPVAWGMPPIVMIEPTSSCNLRCPLCPSGAQELTRAKGFMDFDLFCKVVDEIAPTTANLILWNQGEPFLHTRFTDMIAYASKKGLYTMTSTNANLPFDGDKIVASGLDRIIVSMDGATQETYANYRVGGEVSRVLENLERIRIAKKKAHSRTPFVSLQFLVMRHNEHEIGAMQDIARQVEADSLDLKTVQIYKKEDIAYLPKNPAYRRYKVEGDQFELQFGVHNRCRRIWTQPVVNWNGELSMCCYDKDIDYKIGNLKDCSLRELWHGKKLQRLRAQILKNRAALPVCLNCGEGIKQTIRSTR